MPGYPTHGRARVDPSWPQAFAVCDACQFLYNRVDLSWQMEWMGNALRRTGFLVCQRCYDIPNETNRPPPVFGPDPLAILDPRPEHYDVEVDA